MSLVAIEHARRVSKHWTTKARNGALDEVDQDGSMSRARQRESVPVKVPKHVKNFAIVFGYYVVACLFFCPVEGWSILKVR